MEFLSNLTSPSGAICVLLALGVVLVNGFTDAPNAIATTVSTGALSMNRACLLCAVCNLLGLLVSSAFNMAVADTMLSLVAVKENRTLALCAIFISVIAFSLVAWLLSSPSSESHALIASIAGVSLALSSHTDMTPFFKIVIYMLLSCAISFLLSILIGKLLKNKYLPYGRLQILSCAASSFAHGAQDGQKFVGVLLLLAPTTKGGSSAAVIAVAIFLFLGTLLGGGRIVRSMGNGITDLSEKSGFISDISATLCLLFCSFLGMAVSSGNVKACSIAGAGISDKKAVNYKTLVKMAYVAIITFPACTLLSYLIVKIGIILCV